MTSAAQVGKSEQYDLFATRSKEIRIGKVEAKNHAHGVAVRDVDGAQSENRKIQCLGFRAMLECTSSEPAIKHLVDPREQACGTVTDAAHFANILTFGHILDAHETLKLRVIQHIVVSEANKFSNCLRWRRRPETCLGFSVPQLIVGPFDAGSVQPKLALSEQLCLSRGRAPANLCT